MLRIAQTVKREEEFLTVPTRYEQIMRFVGNEQSELARKYKADLLGPSLIAGAPTRYYELSAMHNLGISPNVWEAMSIEDRGEHVAYLRLSNMAAIIERNETLDQQRKEDFARRAKERKPKE